MLDVSHLGPLVNVSGCYIIIWASDTSLISKYCPEKSLKSCRAVQHYFLRIVDVYALMFAMVPLFSFPLVTSLIAFVILLITIPESMQTE